MSNGSGGPGMNLRDISRRRFLGRAGLVASTVAAGRRTARARTRRTRSSQRASQRLQGDRLSLHVWRERLRQHGSAHRPGVVVDLRSLPVQRSRAHCPPASRHAGGAHGGGRIAGFPRWRPPDPAQLQRLCARELCARVRASSLPRRGGAAVRRRSPRCHRQHRPADRAADQGTVSGRHGSQAGAPVLAQRPAVDVASAGAGRNRARMGRPLRRPDVGVQRERGIHQHLHFRASRLPVRPVGVPVSGRCGWRGSHCRTGWRTLRLPPWRGQSPLDRDRGRPALAGTRIRQDRAPVDRGRGCVPGGPRDVGRGAAWELSQPCVWRRGRESACSPVAHGGTHTGRTLRTRRAAGRSSS